MQNFKKLYIVTSGLLLSTQLLFLFIMVYNKVIFGRVLYYGNPEEQNPGFEKYFKVLEVLLYSTLVLVIFWGLMTPFAVIYNRRSMEVDKMNLFIGVTGFVLAMILLIIDPFGMFKWFTS